MYSHCPPCLFKGESVGVAGELAHEQGKKGGKDERASGWNRGQPEGGSKKTQLKSWKEKELF